MGWSRDPDPFLRFYERIIKDESGCWLWQGKLTPLGYASFTVNNQKVAVHRWAYETFKGPIPEGLVIHHRCENRCCVNPDHLEAVTTKQNNAYANQRCRQVGHPLTEENVIMLKSGRRLCRICHEQRLIKYRKRSNQRRHQTQTLFNARNTFFALAPYGLNNMVLIQTLEDLKQRGLILDFSPAEEAQWSLSDKQL